MQKTLNHTGIKNKLQQLQVENNQLKQENKAYKLIVEEYAKFKTMPARAAHDICSPIATILMLLPQCGVLSENLYNTLKQSANRINDIAQDILNPLSTNPNCTMKPTLISTEILAIVSNKKYEYSMKAIDFVVDIKPQSECAWINVDISAFTRSLSNIINNAVDALDGRKGIITVSVEATKEKVNISVTDNGKGIPEMVAYKIMHGISVSANKANGHGIGLEQVRDMLKSNTGKMSIDSTVGIGTIVKLSFPRLSTSVT